MTSLIRPVADRKLLDSREQFCGLSLPTCSHQRGWFMSSSIHAASSPAVIASTAPLAPCLVQVNPTPSRIASGPTRRTGSGMRERGGKTLTRPFDPANTTSTAVQLSRKGMHARAGPVLLIGHRRPGRGGDERTHLLAAELRRRLAVCHRPCAGFAVRRRDAFWRSKRLDKTLDAPVSTVFDSSLALAGVARLCSGF